MNPDYNLSDYTNDVRGAHGRYTAIIKGFCEFQGAPLPLNDEQMHEAKTLARAHKNQLLSAAGKRLRAGVALRMLDRLQEQVDLTSTLATKITRRLLGRAIDRQVLLDRYGTENRTAANKSPDFKNVEHIVQGKAFTEAEAELTSLLEAAQEIRAQINRQQIEEGEAAQMSDSFKESY